MPREAYIRLIASIGVLRRIMGQMCLAPRSRRAGISLPECFQPSTHPEEGRGAFALKAVTAGSAVKVSISPEDAATKASKAKMQEVRCKAENIQQIHHVAETGAKVII